MREANAAQMNARAQLRPDFSGDLREAAQRTNLAAAGLNFSSLPAVPGVTGFSFTSIVGPYHYFDVRASVTQSVADMTRLHNYRQSKESVRGAAFAAQDSRELTRVSQQNQNTLLRHAVPGNPAFDNLLGGIRQALVNAGVETSVAGQQAYGRVMGMIQLQATTLAYVKVVSLMAIIVACLIPLPMIMRRPPKRQMSAEEMASH